MHVYTIHAYRICSGYAYIISYLTVCAFDHRIMVCNPTAYSKPVMFIQGSGQCQLVSKREVAH